MTMSIGLSLLTGSLGGAYANHRKLGTIDQTIRDEIAIYKEKKTGPKPRAAALG